VYVSKNNQNDKKIKMQLEYEKNIGMTDFKYFEDYSTNVKNHINSLQNTIKKIKENGFTIAGYGASGRGNVLMNICKFNSNDISFIIDESPERYNRFIGGTDIPIFNKDYIINNKTDYLLILAWNDTEMIIEKLKSESFKYVIPFPSVKILDK